MRLLRCNPFNYGGVDEVPVKLASPREVYLLVLKNWKYKSWT
jgi:putative component of membrane protein insertase Oxa1/YidC/SpoIIIJ protein YidD